jgi:hypothetical protein
LSRTNRRFVEAAGSEGRSVEVANRTRRVRVLGKLLDNSIPIPGTPWKVGLDPIIGLIPGVGDFVGALMSGYIVLEAARADIPTVTLVRMLLNVGIDTLVGAVPALGDVFDAAWKANTKNVALLERHLAQAEIIEAPRSSVVGATVFAAIVLLAIVGVGLVLGILVARLLWSRNTG